MAENLNEAVVKLRLRKKQYSKAKFNGEPTQEAAMPPDVLLGKQAKIASLLNKLTVSQLTELGNLSKAYISQVKNDGRLIDALNKQGDAKKVDYLTPFLQSRQSMNVSSNTLELYRFILGRFMHQMDVTRAAGQGIEHYLISIPPNGISLGNRHAHFRVIKTFFWWLECEYGIQSPMHNLNPNLPLNVKIKAKKGI
jgi:hypothetical protein